MHLRRNIYLLKNILEGQIRKCFQHRQIFYSLPCLKIMATIDLFDVSAICGSCIILFFISREHFNLLLCNIISMNTLFLNLIKLLFHFRWNSLSCKVTWVLCNYFVTKLINFLEIKLFRFFLFLNLSQRF